MGIPRARQGTATDPGAIGIPRFRESSLSTVVGFESKSFGAAVLNTGGEFALLEMTVGLELVRSGVGTAGLFNCAACEFNAPLGLLIPRSVFPDAPGI